MGALLAVRLSDPIIIKCQGICLLPEKTCIGGIYFGWGFADPLSIYFPPFQELKFVVEGIGVVFHYGSGDATSSIVKKNTEITIGCGSTTSLSQIEFEVFSNHLPGYLTCRGLIPPTRSERRARPPVQHTVPSINFDFYLK